MLPTPGPIADNRSDNTSTELPRTQPRERPSTKPRIELRRTSATSTRRPDLGLRIGNGGGREAHRSTRRDHRAERFLRWAWGPLWRDVGIIERGALIFLFVVLVGAWLLVLLAVMPGAAFGFWIAIGR